MYSALNIPDKIAILHEIYCFKSNIKGAVGNSYSTFVSIFTTNIPWRLNGEDTEQMYSKHLSV